MTEGRLHTSTQSFHYPEGKQFSDRHPQKKYTLRKHLSNGNSQWCPQAMLNLLRPSTRPHPRHDPQALLQNSAPKMFRLPVVLCLGHRRNLEKSIQKPQRPLPCPPHLQPRTNCLSTNRACLKTSPEDEAGRRCLPQLVTRLVLSVLPLLLVPWRPLQLRCQPKNT